MIERIEINLLPAEYRIHTTRLYLQKEILIPLFLFIGVLTGIGGLTFYYESQIAGISRKIERTSAEIEKKKPILAQIQNLETQRGLVQEKIRALQRIDVNREKWIRLQEVFCEKLPEVTWIEKIEERKDSSSVLEVEGKTYSFSEVAIYMTALTENEFISSVDLVNIEQIGGAENIYRFIILCKVNPDARLGGFAGRGE